VNERRDLAAIQVAEQTLVSAVRTEVHLRPKTGIVHDAHVQTSTTDRRGTRIADEASPQAAFAAQEVAAQATDAGAVDPPESWSTDACYLFGKF